MDMGGGRFFVRDGVWPVVRDNHGVLCQTGAACRGALARRVGQVLATCSFRCDACQTAQHAESRSGRAGFVHQAQLHTSIICIHSIIRFTTRPTITEELATVCTAQQSTAAGQLARPTGQVHSNRFGHSSGARASQICAGLCSMPLAEMWYCMADCSFIPRPDVPTSCHTDRRKAGACGRCLGDRLCNLCKHACFESDEGCGAQPGPAEFLRTLSSSQ